MNGPLVFAIFAFYVYSPIVARNISGEVVQAFESPPGGIPLETIRPKLEFTLGKVTSWVPGTDETQSLQDQDLIRVIFQPELVLITGSHDCPAKITSFHGQDTETITLPGPVSRVAFSSDRSHFAISYIDGCKLFSDSHKRCRTFSSPPLEFECITFSPDGKWMFNEMFDDFTVNQSKIFFSIHSIDDEEKPLVLRGSLLMFSPDNERIVFVSTEHIVHIIEDMGGKILKKIRPPARSKAPYDSLPVTGASFSHDGKLLAINYDAKIQIIDIESGKLVKTIEASEQLDVTDNDEIEFGLVLEMLFSPNGKYLVTLNAFHGLVFWKVSDWTFEKFFDEKDITNLFQNLAIAFDPTGQYLAISINVDVCIVDTDAWKISYFHKIHEKTITDVAFGYRNVWTLAILSSEKHVKQQEHE